jgi:hypothetical protein
MRFSFVSVPMQGFIDTYKTCTDVLRYFSLYMPFLTCTNDKTLVLQTVDFDIYKKERILFIYIVREIYCLMSVQPYVIHNKSVDI